MDIFRAEHISKKYATHQALDDFSIRIPEGKIVGLLGPNGAGKTTLIRIINQIIGPDTGALYFNEEKLIPAHAEKIGYLPEERGLYKKMKVGEQALYLARLKGLSKKEAKQKLDYWFEKFQLEGWWNKKIEELSKGMQQKVQFICTILHEPELLIFDEPFTGFDPINAELIKNEILELKAKGATVIFSTHRMESVEELCDHIALVNRSRKILDGPLREIRLAHRNNHYIIIFEGNDEYVKNKIPQGAELLHQDILSSGEIKLEIKFPAGFLAGNFLKEIATLVDIRHFNENIPSVNDIFIQKITAQA